MTQINENPGRSSRTRPRAESTPGVDSMSLFDVHSQAPDGRSADSGQKSGERRRSGDTVEAGSLPPFGLLISRPILLLVCALLGALLGVVVTGYGGYRSEAVLQFSVRSSDSTVVKQTGQTIARTVTADDIIKAVASQGGIDAVDLVDRIDAEWLQDTQLVSVVVTGSSEESAIAGSNAVAGAVVSAFEASVRDRLTAAATESQALLQSGVLASPEAENARVASLGTALASRQDAIASESGSLAVADPALQATPAGLTKPMGAVIGLLAGLLLGGLAALLLGMRGLRTSSGRALRHLVPEHRLAAPAQAPQLAGEFIESGKNLLAVVVPDEAHEQGESLAKEIADYVRAHGWTVGVAGLDVTQDWPSALSVVRWDVRDNVRDQFGVDLLVVVVAAESAASALLEGQSNLAAIVVARRRRTRTIAALQTLRAFKRAEPTLVLAR